MANDNIHIAAASLGPGNVKAGGLCGRYIQLFKWEDVLAWPAVDPATGIIATAISMKPGKSVYQVYCEDPDREFSELGKRDGAGPYFDIEVKAISAGDSSALHLSVEAMKFHEWGIIVDDRSGVTRLIGDEDSGAQFNYNYTSGDRNSSRKRQLRWSWQSPQTCPQYQSNTFSITIGGVTITAGSLALIMRFQVGAPGAPMVDAQTTLVNALFANKNILVLADGMGLPLDDGSGAIDFTGLLNRHVHKTLAGTTITFYGGVVEGEIIEIYGWT